MMRKCFVFVFVALFAVQGLTVQGKSFQSSRDLITDEFLKLIKRLQEILDKAIDDAISKLPELKNDVEKLADKILNDIETKTQVVIDAGFKLIDDLKKEAADHNINIDLCVDKQEDEIHKVANDIVTSTSACVKYNVGKADSILQLAIQQIQARREIVKQIEKDFAECQDFLCHVKVIGRLNKLIVDLPIEIAKFLLNTQNTIFNIQKDIAICLTNNAMKIGTDLQPIIDNVIECIKEKIHGNKLEPRAIPEPYDLIEEVMKLLTELQDKVNEAAQSLIDELPNLVNQVKEASKKVLDDLDKLVQETITKAFDAIEKAKEEAEKLGINVDLCIGNEKDRIEEIAKGISEDTKNCVNNNLDQVDGIVVAAQKDLQEVLDEVKTITEEVKNCNGNLFCLLQESSKLPGLLLRLPAKILATLTKTKVKFAKMETEIAACLAKNTLALTNKVKPVVENVLKCITDKIHGGNNNVYYWKN